MKRHATVNVILNCTQPHQIFVYSMLCQCELEFTMHRVHVFNL